MKRLITAAVITLSFTAAMTAQEVASRGADFTVACPHPISTTIKGANPPAPDPADFGSLYHAVQGSHWNQTVADKAFGTTFRLPPTPGSCCVWTSATVVLTIKALQGGAFNTPSSGNDGVNIISHGVGVASVTPWPNGATTGETKSITITVPASVLASRNEFSLYVQDDTAVLDAVVRFQGCCVK
jgi:hypothetical protein